MSVYRKRLTIFNLDNYWGKSDIRIALRDFVNRPLTALFLAVTKGSLVGGSSPAWVTGAGDKIIKNVRLLVNGDIYVKSMTWEQAKVLSLLAMRKKASEGYVYLLFSKEPEDISMGLPTPAIKSMDLVVDVEALANVTTGSPTGTSGTTLAVWSVESLLDLAVAEKLSFYKHISDYIQKGTVTGEHLYKVPIGSGEIITRLLLKTLDGNTASNTVCERYKVLVNDIERFNLTYAESREQDINEYGLTETYDTGYTCVDFGVTDVKGAVAYPSVLDLIFVVSTTPSTGFNAYIVREAIARL